MSGDWQDPPIPEKLAHFIEPGVWVQADNEPADQGPCVEGGPAI